MGEKAEPSKDKGKYIWNRFKLTKKDKKHSGRYTPKIEQKGKISEMFENAEEPKEEYDDWGNYRDGFRFNSDKKHFFSKWRSCHLSEEKVFRINKKIKKQKAIRKTRKK
ncbi:hypothetical protein LCGC14_2466870 [marine sediment metagenome]|uniref:Uncharacterized protein n=1 Tax=marine sediment metagenome TaxID=412755 RepID=A0A0F9E5K2_9ZZZZ